MTKHDTYQQPYPTCPHCGHQLNADKMNYGPDVSEDGPGQFDTCPGCARKGYLCGSFVLDKNSTQYQQWVERTREKYRGKSGQKNQSPEAHDETD